MYWSNSAILKPYRANIAKALRTEVKNHEDFEVVKDSGFCISVEFRTNRPKSHFLTSGKLNPKAPKRLVKIPDYADKGARAVLDAITDSGVIYVDDAQVTDLHSRKRYATEQFPEGTYILITDTEDPKW